MRLSLPKLTMLTEERTTKSRLARDLQAALIVAAAEFN